MSTMSSVGVIHIEHFFMPKVQYPAEGIDLSPTRFLKTCTVSAAKFSIAERGSEQCEVPITFSGLLGTLQKLSY